MQLRTRNIQVAVYGTLKRGYPNHVFLKNCEFLGLDRLPGIVLYDLGWFPGARFEGCEAIDVEVFAVCADTLKLLDDLEGYRPEAPETSYFLRSSISSRFGDVWIYTFNNSVDGFDVVASGVW